MKKLEFNPMIIDYSPPKPSDYEYIGPGVKKYIARPSLKDVIEKLNFDELLDVFQEMEKYNKGNKGGIVEMTINRLYNEHLDTKGINLHDGFNKVYHLICEKIAMDWMNEKIV